MNYESPTLLEPLAGAYVLGTLRGRARVRFERLLADSERVRAAQQHWEDRLLPLIADLQPVTPRAQVWPKIAGRIQPQPSSTSPRRTSWRWLLAGALAVSVLVGISIRLLNLPSQAPSLQSIAALGTDATHVLWDVSRTATSSALTIRALQNIATNPQSAYELWALSKNGKAPVSLGLLPRSGSIERQLTGAQRLALLSANKIAVSLEPAGGSPTGTPTGPVLYVANVVNAI